MWLQALRSAQQLDADELPATSPTQEGPPPPNRWADREPAAAARLTAARAALTEIAEENSLPSENLLLPDLVRRVCWSPPDALDVDSVQAVLRDKGAREWQIALTASALTTALRTQAE